MGVGRLVCRSVLLDGAHQGPDWFRGVTAKEKQMKELWVLWLLPEIFDMAAH